MTTHSQQPLGRLLLALAIVASIGGPAAADDPGSDSPGSSTLGTDGEDGSPGRGENDGTNDAPQPTATSGPPGRAPDDAWPPSDAGDRDDDRGLDLRLPSGPGRLGRGFDLARGLTLHPHGRLAAFWTDNAARTTEDAQSDVELSTTAGVDLRLAGERGQAQLGYAFTWRDYLQDRGIDSDEHRGRFSCRGAFGQRWTASAWASVAHVTQTTFDSVLTGNVERIEADGGATLACQVSRRVSLLLEPRGRYVDYREDLFDPQDGYEDGAQGHVGVQVRRMRLELGGGWRELRFTDRHTTNADLGVWSATTGVVLPESRRLGGSLRVGYEASYVIERRALPAGTDLPEGVTVTGDLHARPRRPTVLTLVVSRRIGLSAAAAAQLTSASLTWEERLPWRLLAFVRGSVDLTEPISGPSFLGHGADAGLTWQPRPWIQLGVQASYFHRTSQAGDFEVLSLGVALTLTA